MTPQSVQFDHPLFLTTEQELFHFFNCGGGGGNAVGDPPPAASEGRGGAAIGSHTGQGVGTGKENTILLLEFEMNILAFHYP